MGRRWCAAANGADASVDAKRRHRASDGDPEHTADGDQPELADDAGPPPSSRRQGGSCRADPREGGDAGAVVAATATAVVRGADLARQTRGRGAFLGAGGGDRSALLRAARTVLRAAGQLGRVGRRLRGSDRWLASTEPRLTDSLRGRVDQHGGRRGEGAPGPRRTAQDEPERHARAVHAVHGGAHGGRREGRGSHGAENHLHRSDQRRRPARAGVGAVRSIRIQADRRARGAAREGPVARERPRVRSRRRARAARPRAAATGQLGRRDRGVHHGEDPHARRPRGRCVSRAGALDGPAIRPRGGAGARVARARSRSAAHGAPARAGAAEGGQDRRREQAARRCRRQTAEEP